MSKPSRLSRILNGRITFFDPKCPHCKRPLPEMAPGSTVWTCSNCGATFTWNLRRHIFGNLIGLGIVTIVFMVDYLLHSRKSRRPRGTLQRCLCGAF